MRATHDAPSVDREDETLIIKLPMRLAIARIIWRLYLATQDDD